MHEQSSSNNADYLSPDEQTFVSSGGIEKAGRVLLSQAAAKFIVELGLPYDASGQFVDAFRSIEMHELESSLASSIEIASAIDHLREVLTRRGAVAVRSAELATAIAKPDVPMVVAEVAPAEGITSDPTVPEHVQIEPHVSNELGTHIIENTDDNEALQPIQLSDRGQRYLQSIFGSLDELPLQENDKPIIVSTITKLRGSPKGGHEFVDMTPRILMMFEGMRDAEIAAQVNVTPASVATSFSNLVRKIKLQPTFSYVSARAMLEADLARIVARSSDAATQTDAVTYEEGDAVYYETAEPIRIETPEFKQTLQTGQLVGAIRRYLRKAGHDHTISLDESILAASIDHVFDAHENLADLRENYLLYLAKGIKPLGDSALNECIATMHEYIAERITAIEQPSERSNVLPITTPTHHQHKPESVTPANMPLKRSVLPFVAPQSKSPIMQKPVGRVEIVNGGEVEDVPLLITAAYREETMSPAVWYKTAFEQMQESARTLNMTDDEAAALWKTVHFNGKRSDGSESRSLLVKEALKKVEECMIERASKLEQYPDLKFCLQRLLNNFSSQNDLMAIQYALKKNTPTIYEHAAQRYVVAGISVLTKE